MRSPCRLLLSMLLFPSYINGTVLARSELCHFLVWVDVMVSGVVFLITNLEREKMARGTVKWFSEEKGYGFITPEDGSKDVFVHISAVERSDLGYLTDGQKVSFDTQEDARGLKAVNLQAA